MSLVRTQVQLTQEQDERLEAMAHSTKRSKADLVREAVQLLIETRPPHRTRREIRERALAAIGRFDSGLTDVAENHDAYLADAFDHSR